MTNRNQTPVVITRPHAQALLLAQRVAALGRDVVVFPLLEIHPLEDQAALRAALADVAAYALVVFVSPNAIDAAFAVRSDWPVTLAVVGEGSRAALARHGLTAENACIISPLNRLRTDSQTLLEVLDLEALKGKRVMIVRGESGRELLADALTAAGAEVVKVPAYRRMMPVPDEVSRAQLRNLLAQGAEWVITSSEALRNLLQLVEDAVPGDGVARIRQQRIVVPHIRIAETAQTLGFTDIVQTGSGDEQLLTALQFQA